MRFEAHLQDLAREQQTKVVAVQLSNEPVYVDEVELDALTRELCARELAMNALEPNLGVPRELPGGGSFCLQAFVPPIDNQFTVVRFQHASTLNAASSSADEVGDEDSDSKEPRHTSPSSASWRSADRSDGRYSFVSRLWERAPSRYSSSAPRHDTVIAESLQRRVEALVRDVVTHFHVFFGLRMVDATLEFALEATSGVLHLVSAQHIKIHRVSSTPMTSHRIGSKHATQRRQRKLQRSARPTTNRNESLATSSHTSDLDADLSALATRSAHTNVRVCRQCRSAQHVELAQELAQRQRTLRRVLSNYQTAQEERAAAQHRESESHELLARQRQTIATLQLELDRARESLRDRDSQIEALERANAALQTQVAGAGDDVRAAKLQIELVEKRLVEAEQATRAAVQHRESNSHRQMQHATQQQTLLQAQLEQLQHELERTQLTLRKLQTKYEEVRADRDELRFQWRFVHRKLVDVKEPGVAPPPRIAGGYQSYPAPSDANVRDVVKWLVDYSAKRALVDAHKKKSVAKRLQLKLELMRVLGSPKKRRGTARIASSSPRRRSRSPSKSVTSSPVRSRATERRSRCIDEQEGDSLSPLAPRSSRDDNAPVTLLARSRLWQLE